MKKIIRLCIIVISILMLLLTGCNDSKYEEKANSSFDFNSLIEKVIIIQHGNKDIKEADFFPRDT
jgi:uncharacterized lipoprotein YehR (DUF1307 family)